QNLRLCLLPRW
ncbi:unnamed protein product, partial [Allacma fusca]